MKIDMLHFREKTLKLLKNNLFNSSWACFAFYFITLIIIGLWIRDVANQPNILISFSEFMITKPSLYQDPITFASGAKDIYENSWFTGDYNYLLNLWPPGFILLEGWILKLFGTEAPFILILLIINAAFLALTLAIFRLNLIRVSSLTTASLLPLVPFIFPLPRFFLLQPAGLIQGETFSITFFLLGSLLLLLSTQKRLWRLTILAGLSFALSTYFRSQFEVIIIFLTLTAIALGLGLYIIGFICPCKKINFDPQIFSIKAIMLSLLVAHLIMLPWRIYNHNSPYHGKYSWVKTESLVYQNASKTTEELEQAGGHWLVIGKENLACKLEPDYCGNPSKEGFYKAFLFNIPQWTIEKFSVFDDYWYAPLFDLMLPSHESTISDLLFNTINALFLILALPLLWLIRRKTEFMALSLVIIGVYSCFYAVFTLVHFETRYLYAIKIIGLFIAPLLFTLYRARSKNEEIPVRTIN